MRWKKLTQLTISSSESVSAVTTIVSTGRHIATCSSILTRVAVAGCKRNLDRFFNSRMNWIEWRIKLFWKKMKKSLFHTKFWNSGRQTFFWFRSKNKEILFAQKFGFQEGSYFSGLVQPTQSRNKKWCFVLVLSTGKFVSESVTWWILTGSSSESSPAVAPESTVVLVHTRSAVLARRAVATRHWKHTIPQLLPTDVEKQKTRVSWETTDALVSYDTEKRLRPNCLSFLRLRPDCWLISDTRFFKTNVLWRNRRCCDSWVCVTNRTHLLTYRIGIASPQKPFTHRQW